MNPRPSDRLLEGWPHLVIIGVLAFIAATIFVIDLTTLHGVTVWVLYLPLCMLVAWFDRPREAIAAAVVATVLILAAAWLSPQSVAGPVGLVNRSLELLTIWLATVLVITRRQSARDAEKSAQAVREANARLAGILDNADDAIVALDGRQNVTLFNRGAERTFGYAADEVVGKSHALLLPPAAAVTHRRLVEEFGASGVQARRMAERSTVTARRKDGSEFPAEVSISKFVLRDGMNFTAILRDITERIKTEDLLRERERRLHLALSAGHMGVFQVDETTRWARMDETSARLLELDGGVLEMPAHDFFAKVDAADRDTVRATIEKARVAGGDYSLEFRLPGANGKTRWIAVRGHSELDARKRPLRTTGVAYDITERKHAQEVLEARVAERTAALQSETSRREAAQAALAHAQKLQAVGELAGGMAHNFNNLLTVIVGNLELLGLRQLDDRARDLIRRAEESAKMGARLTRRLLAIGRKQTLQPEVLNLNEIAQSMTDVLRRTLGDAIEIQADFAADLWPTLADVSEIENAILNLAINARDAMPDGGRLVVTTANRALAARDVENEPEFKPGDYVMLSIGDTGAGIPPETLARIFEPFYTTKETGTGLGLSTIYGFAKQSGGHLAIESEIGKGTTVRLYLPRASGMPAAARPAAHEAAAADGETVLVVEDDADVRNTTVSRLDMLGYRVATANDGPAAVKVLQSSDDIDLVFSDVAMPGGMSGFDLARWVQTNRPQVKVLLASGFTRDAALTGEAALQRLTVLEKPYLIADLARAVRQTLSAD